MQIDKCVQDLLKVSFGLLLHEVPVLGLSDLSKQRLMPAVLHDDEVSRFVLVLLLNSTYVRVLHLEHDLYLPRDVRNSAFLHGLLLVVYFDGKIASVLWLKPLGQDHSRVTARS